MEEATDLTLAIEFRTLFLKPSDAEHLPKQFQAVVQKADKNKPLSVLVRRGEWVNYLVIRPAR